MQSWCVWVLLLEPSFHKQSCNYYYYFHHLAVQSLCNGKFSLAPEMGHTGSDLWAGNHSADAECCFILRPRHGFLCDVGLVLCMPTVSPEISVHCPVSTIFPKICCFWLCPYLPLTYKGSRGQCRSSVAEFLMVD